MRRDVELVVVVPLDVVVVVVSVIPVLDRVSKTAWIQKISRSPLAMVIRARWDTG